MDEGPKTRRSEKQKATLELARQARHAKARGEPTTNSELLEETHVRVSQIVKTESPLHWSLQTTVDNSEVAQLCAALQAAEKRVKCLEARLRITQIRHCNRARRVNRRALVGARCRCFQITRSRPLDDASTGTILPPGAASCVDKVTNHTSVRSGTLSQSLN